MMMSVIFELFVFHNLFLMLSNVKNNVNKNIVFVSKMLTEIKKNIIIQAKINHMSEESFRADNSVKSTAVSGKKGKKERKKVKSTTFASGLASVVLIAVVIIGAGYYFQTKAADENEKQSLSEMEKQYQSEIEKLNEQIKELKERDKQNRELIQRDLPEAARVVKNCSQNFELKYQEFDEKIPFYLKYNNRPFQYYQKQGYELKQICQSNERFLMLLDSAKRFENALGGQSATADLKIISSKIILGLSDKMFFKMNYYPVKIENYSLAENEKTFCVFDQFADNEILYICKSENDFAPIVWYAFDTIKKLNQKVKIEYAKNESESKVFDEELLNLFSKKSFK